MGAGENFVQIQTLQQLHHDDVVFNTKTKILSLDFFDTLVKRKRAESWIIREAFFTVNQQLSNPLTWEQFWLLREQAYAETGRTNGRFDAAQEVTLHTWYSALFRIAGCQSHDAVAARFCTLLENAERENLELNDGARKLLLKAREAGHRIILLSDTYYDDNAFAGFLSHLGISALIDAIYLSCELGLNKASGRLFHHVLRKEQIPASAFVHIGDNPNADIRQAQKNQITAIHLSPDQPDRQYSRDEQKQALIEFGRSNVAPLIAAFCRWLHANTPANVKLVFLARDGFLAYSAYQSLYPQANASYAYINRVVSNQLSVCALDKNTISFVLRRYRADGLSALVKAFGLFDSPFSAALTAFCEKNGFSMEHLLDEACSEKICGDGELKSTFASSLEVRRSQSIRYLENIFSPDTLECCLVDVGWRGSIFQSLAQQFPCIRSVRLLCLTEEPQRGLQGAVNTLDNPSLTQAMSEYRDILEWLMSEQVGAIKYIDGDCLPVFQPQENVSQWAKTTVQQGIREGIVGLKTEAESGREQTLSVTVEQWLSALKGCSPAFYAAIQSVDTEMGIDGKSQVSFADLLRNHGGSPKGGLVASQKAMEKQALIGQVLDLVDRLTDCRQLVLYGAGSGFNFILPFVKDRVAWIVDINRQLHGKYIDGILVKGTDSLEQATDTILVTVIGRKNQVAPFLVGVRADVLFLEDFL